MPKSFEKPTPIKGVAPLTEEAKKAKVAQFFMQKRETFSLNILCHLCDKLSVNTPEQRTAIINISVEMADQLLEKLYPLPEDTTKS